MTTPKTTMKKTETTSSRRNLSSLFVSTMLLTSISVVTAVNRIDHPTPRQDPHRSLAIGDFDVVNKLYDGVEIAMPDPPPIETEFGGSTLTLNLSNIVCRRLTLGDMDLDWSMAKPHDFRAVLELIQWTIDCSMNYDFEYIFGMGGQGVVDVMTQENNAAAVLLFESIDFDEFPPTKFDVESCKTEVIITDVNFKADGLNGVLAGILNAIESSLREVVSNEIETFMCEYLNEVEISAANMLENASRAMERFLEVGAREPVPPLEAENALQVPDGVKLIDFQKPETMVATAISKVIEQASGFARNEVDDGKGGKTMVINNFIRDRFLESDGGFAIDVDFARDNKFDSILGSMEMNLTSVRLFGLDSFTHVDDLEKVGKYTLQTNFTLAAQRLEIGAELAIRPPSAMDDSKVVGESFVVDVSLDSVDASVAVLLAVDEAAVGEIALGSLLQMDNLLPCVLSTIFELQVASLRVGDINILQPSINGLESPGLQNIIQSLLESGFALYGPSLSKAIPAMLQTTVIDMFGSTIADIADASCPSPKESVEGKYIDFHEMLAPIDETETSSRPYGDVPPMLKRPLDSQLLAIDSSTGLAKVNNVIAPLIEAWSNEESNAPGRIAFSGDLFKTDTRVQLGGLDARLQLRAGDAFIENLDTIGAPLHLLETVDGKPHQLNNSASIGVERPLRLGLRVLIQLSSEGSEIKNDFNISMGFDTATFVLTALLKVAESKFLQFPLADVTNYHCWLSTLPAPPLDASGLRLKSADPSLALAEMAMSVARLNMDVSCNDCSGTGMAEWEALLNTTEASEDATNVANVILTYVAEFVMGDFAQTKMDRLLNEASKQCPHSPDYDPNYVTPKYSALSISNDQDDESLSFFVALLVGFGCLFVVVAAILLTTKCIVWRRHRKWLHSLSAPQVYILSENQRKDKEKESYVNDNTKALFHSEVIPFWVRLMVPVIILGNIGFFLSGHLSLGATVNIQATLAGQTFVADGFFEFSMAKSTIDIWEAGGKELAILILLFSGIWPYTKQLITLVLWFLPPRAVSASKRESIFLCLDALAKYSIIDIFVLVITVAGFRISVQSPSVGFLPGNFYSLDLLVIPMWGLYANMIAQLISQISSHYIIHFHRRVVSQATTEYDKRFATPSSSTVAMGDDESAEVQESAASEAAEQVEKDMLFSHAFARPHRGESDRLVPRPWVNPMMAFAVFTLVALVIVGCTLPSLSLEVLGIVGILVESGQEFTQATTQYSVFSIIEMFFDQASVTGRTADYVGLGSLSVLLLLTVLVVPIIQAVVLAYQWFYRLGHKKRRRLAVLVEILSAWQYAEVYLIALIVASWQFGPVSEFMINEYCNTLKEMFSELVYSGIISADDAQCFRVDAKIEDGWFVLAGAAVLLALLNTFVMKAVAQRFRDEDIERRTLPEDHKLDDSVREAASEIDLAKTLNGINPVPVLFTDTFRWFLSREDIGVSGSQSNQDCSSSDAQSFNEGDEHELQDVSLSEEANI